MTGYAKAAGIAVNLIGLNPQEVIGAGVEFMKTRETEITEREWIRANYQAFLAALQAEQESLLTYFEYRFAERREALHEFYQVLHTAVETGDDHQLDAAICGILGIIKDNPLTDYEQFKRAFNDPDAIIEL